MKIFGSSDIRNVAVVGHARCGKTALVSSLLRTARAGAAASAAPEDTPALAADEEEAARGMTLGLHTYAAIWNGCKINLLDTPGFHAFAHEARSALFVAETAAIVIDAHSGIASVADRMWNRAASLNLPRVVVIQQIDHAADAADRMGVLLDTMRERWGRHVIPVQLPIVDDGGLAGVVDLVSMEAFLYTRSGSGIGRSSAIPQELVDAAKQAHEALVELVAEGKDELMDEFFAVGTIPEEHLRSAVHEAIREDRLFPVVFSDALSHVGIDHLLDFVQTYAPSPLERAPVQGREHRESRDDGDASAPGARAIDDAGPLTVYVYKTWNDPFAGRLSLFKVLSGCVRTGGSLDNYSRGGDEKIGHPGVAHGGQISEVSELHAGDLGAVAKLQSAQTGDVLGVRGQSFLVEPIPLPDPVITVAIEPQTRADEDRLASAVGKLIEEDPALRFFRDPQTGEFLLAGTGQAHLDVAVSRLRRRYHTEVTLKSPKVPYRETIRARATGHGRHKKQSGGHGQFGDCTIVVEPLPRGAGFEFVNSIFGGAIPRVFIPAVEKGIRESAARGHLAGFPVVDFRATLTDGSYHDVDSSELSFKLAAHAAFRACMEQARPALLEPVMRVEIEVPDEFSGVVLSDLNGRRARVLGMDTAASGTLLNADVPLAEMLTYGAALTSITQGKGSFRMEMDHYDFVPTATAERIVSSAKQSASEGAASKQLSPHLAA